MLNFDLNDEQRLLEQSVREWGAKEIAPHIKEADRQHRFDRDRVIGGMARLGLLGISVSPAKSSSTWTPRCASSCRCTLA
jgi:alkylation response protein AidB-like acyl-CoA dehydrogenase